MNECKVLIMINPIRAKGGTVQYIKTILSRIEDKYDQIILMSPVHIHIKNKKVKIFTFNTYGGMGALFLGVNPSYLFTLWKIIRKLKGNNKRYSLTIALNTPFGAFSIYLLSRILKISHLVYISHNVEIKRYENKGVSVQELKITKILSYFVKFLENISTHYHTIISISPQNKRKLRDIYLVPPDKIHVVPPCICDGKSQLIHTKTLKKKNSRVRIVFHGTYEYYPNQEAANLIKEYISKNVNKYLSHFIILGRGFPKFQEGNVVSLGYVDNLDEFLMSCDLAIMPLKRGDGVKIKGIDYIRAGIPVVTTQIGAEGLPLVHGKNSIITEDVDDTFVEWIEYLVENPKIRKKLKRGMVETSKKLFK